MKKLHFVYNNIELFYKNALTPNKFGSINRHKQFLKSDDPVFRGLCLTDIIRYKYGYNKNLDQIKNLSADLNLGGSSKKYIYDEFDGDDMNYDRLLEGFPAMRKRIKQYGIGSGRLINIYIVISESWNIHYDNMLNKSITAMQIIDLLETIGYRVAVYACDSTRDECGNYNEEKDIHYQLMVCLKNYNDSLNKPLIMNGISPWFFRYFMFAHKIGHYNASMSLGTPTTLDVPMTKETIIINKGECLSENSSKEKIKQIIKLFGI